MSLVSTCIRYICKWFRSVHKVFSKLPLNLLHKFSWTLFLKYLTNFFFSILKENYSLQEAFEKETGKYFQTKHNSEEEIVRQRNRFALQLESLIQCWIHSATNTQARSCYSNCPVFALHVFFRAKICMFLLSLNSHEKAECRQTVPTVYMRKRFLFIVMISWITTI